MTWLLRNDTLNCHPLLTFAVNIATRSRYLLPNTVAFGRRAILKSARKSTIFSFLRPFYKMAEKNWRVMSFILWPLSATNIYQRVLGFVLLRCLACEGTWLSLFRSGTAGSISHLHMFRIPRCANAITLKLYITFKVKREWKYGAGFILNIIFREYSFISWLIFKIVRLNCTLLYQWPSQ